MTLLLLALVLGAPVGPQRGVGGYASDAACSVSVLAVDPQGRLLRNRTVSGSRTPAVVFRGRAAHVSEGYPPLLFDVFNPKGQRYQVLLGSASGRSATLQGRSQSSGGPVEATMAVAGSSIAWTSMFGRWQVVPRFEGQDSPCGPAQAFTILP